MYFAKIDIFCKVLKVIEADQDCVDLLPGQWVPCDINGIFPKNYPAIGDTFDISRRAYISAKPHPSWVLNEDTCCYDPPSPMPDDGRIYKWMEDSQSWICVES